MLDHLFQIFKTEYFILKKNMTWHSPLELNNRNIFFRVLCTYIFLIYSDATYTCVLLYIV